ncbi:MAG: DUF952 domain-containing protein [Acetobacteraceae bacterium]|nr:DUF952 domain-containing protein [Acetobacteraceae bacterium]
MSGLLHVTTQAAWRAAQAEGGYAAPAGGFIHLCTDAQLPFVLRRHFVGCTGLLVLRLDPAGLDVRWEESEPGMPPFPHLYGSLPAAAVRRVEPA